MADNRGRFAVTAQFSSRPHIENSIIFYNTDSLEERSDSVLDVKSSIVQGEVPWPGSGNLTAPPRFVGRGQYDFDRVRRIEGLNRSLPDFVLKAGNHRLLEDSPAIDGGRPEGTPLLDLDGRERPCGSAPDIGSYEFCPGADSPFLRGDINGDGELNIGDALGGLFYLFLGNPISCEDAVDVDDGGEATVTDVIHLLGYLFLEGPEPARPYPECGLDGTADTFPLCLYPPESCR
jgi:hypothetical protein